MADIGLTDVEQIAFEQFKLKNEVIKLRKMLEDLTIRVQKLEADRQVTTSRGKMAQKQQKGRSKALEEFKTPLSVLLDKLVALGALKPVDPLPPPNPLPASYNASKHCKFHQALGHDTDSCRKLRRKVQNLIEQGVIPSPPSKSAAIINQPSEENQMNLLVRSPQPSYYRHMSGATLIDFGHLYKTRVKVEEGMRNGLLENVGIKETKKSYGSSSNSSYGSRGGGSYPNRTVKVNFLGRQPNRPRDQPRTFTELGAPMSVTLKRLMDKDVLRPIGPVLVADPPPPWFNRSQYCAFHEQVGHPTDRCPRLRHEIEDLIQKGIIPKPPTEPNVIGNPMPNHAIPPPEGI